MDRRVTVVFGVYNHEDFVEESFLSLLKQDYGQFTILVYDDCSTDRSFEKVKSMAEAANGPHEIILHRNERNLLNDGFFWDVIPSEYWIQAHADDIFMPDRIRTTMETFEETGAAVLSSNAVIIDKDGAPRGMRTNPDEFQDLSLEAFTRDGKIATCFGAGMAFHRDVFEKFSPKPSYLLNTDQIMPFRGCLIRGAAYIPRPLLKWRWHGKNMTYNVRIRLASKKVEQIKNEKQRLMARVANSLAMIESLYEFEPLDGKDPQGVLSRREVLRDRLVDLHIRSTKELVEFEDRLRRALRGEPGIS